MSQPEHDPNRRSPPELETTVLHLEQFAHGTPVPPERPSENDCATTLIRRVAAETIAEAPKPVVVPANASPLSPDELLGAVAYCYVKGVFSSSDIERKMLRDSDFRAALGGVVPDPATIRKFRRMNREAIQRVLEKFYVRLRRQQKNVDETGRAAPSSPTHTDSRDLFRRREDENTATFTRREATERLDRATFIDGMSDY